MKLNMSVYFATLAPLLGFLDVIIYLLLDGYE